MTAESLAVYNGGEQRTERNVIGQLGAEGQLSDGRETPPDRAYRSDPDDQAVERAPENRVAVRQQAGQQLADQRRYDEVDDRPSYQQLPRWMPPVYGARRVSVGRPSVASWIRNTRWSSTVALVRTFFARARVSLGDPRSRSGSVASVAATCHGSGLIVVAQVRPQ